MKHRLPTEVEFSCDLGDDEDCQVLISENDLPLDEDTLRRLHITSAKLAEIFAEAKELAKDIKPNDSARIVADRGWGGEFLVARCKYTPREGC